MKHPLYSEEVGIVAFLRKHLSEEQARLLATLIVLNADIERGQLGYAASMAINLAQRDANHSLPEETQTAIWKSTKPFLFAFDQKDMRIMEYAKLLAVATWNGNRSPQAIAYLIDHANLYEHIPEEYGDLYKGH